MLFICLVEQGAVVSSDKCFISTRDAGNLSPDQNKLSAGPGSSPPMPPQRSQPLASPRTQRRETTRDFVTGRTPISVEFSISLFIEIF